MMVVIEIGIITTHCTISAHLITNSSPSVPMHAAPPSSSRNSSTASLISFFNNLGLNVPLAAAKVAHLRHVYTILAALCLVALCGHQANVVTARRAVWLNGVLSLVAFPAFIVANCYLACCLQRRHGDSTGRRGNSDALRKGLTAIVCFFVGFLTAHFTEIANFVNPTIVRTALISTLACFCGFTVASFFADSSQLLAVYSLLSMIGCYMLMAIVGSVFTNKFVTSPVYGIASVLVEALYLYKMTLEIVLRDSLHDKEPLDDAYVLFFNLVNLFTKIVEQLINKERRSEDRRRRSDRND